MANLRDRRRATSPVRRAARRVPANFPRVPLHMMAEGGNFFDLDARNDDEDPLSCHVMMESPLTSSTGFSDFHGAFNWAVVLVVLTHVHMNMENFTKHGLFGAFGDPSVIVSYFLKDPFDWLAPYLIIASNMFIFIALVMEKFMTRNRTSETIGKIIQSVNLMALIAFPVLMTHLKKSITPVGSMITLLVYTILFFKLLSYKLVNGFYRHKHPKNAKGTLKKAVPDNRHRRNERGNKVAYPSNLNLRDMYYFVAAPTLCYQLNYPKNPQFRICFFISRLMEMVLLLQLMVALVQQMIVPVIQKSMKPIWEVESSLFLQYILKLAVATNFIWLIFFYWFFHSFLNAIAELLFFGDREFYQDWWNAESILTFWTKWNRPAHNWLFRHVYTPLKHHGYAKLYLQGAVFLISSIVLECLIAIPLQMCWFLIFSAMFTQFLVAWIVERIFGNHYGNLIMWINVFLVVPLVLLLYFHEYYVQHQPTDSSWGLYF